MPRTKPNLTGHGNALHAGFRAKSSPMFDHLLAQLEDKQAQLRDSVQSPLSGEGRKDARR